MVFIDLDVVYILCAHRWDKTEAVALIRGKLD